MRSLQRRLSTILVMLVAAAAAIAVALPAGAAVTGSIVFVRDHNVWIMAADDPSTARPVTTDGTASAPYLLPTQDDHGRILAVAGGEGGNVVWMDQEGTLLAEPFRPPGAGNFQDLDVRADGEVFIHTTYETYTSSQGFVVAPTVDFAFSDGSDPSAVANPAFDQADATYSTDQAFLTSYEDDLGPWIVTYGPGSATLENWFRPCEIEQSQVEDFEAGCFPTFADVTTAQDRLVIAVPASAFVPVGSRLWVFSTSGPPPATPAWGCELVGPEPSSVEELSFRNPEWSPDGSALVYELTPETGSSGTSAIYLATGFDDDCDAAFASAELVVPGGSNPDWSPAPLGADPGPGPDPTDPPDPPDPTDPPRGETPAPVIPDPAQPSGAFDGNPRTTERINASDRIAAALQISRSRFDDGGAARVVLSRDDTFPDSLAGATLTADGPLLFTPTNQLHEGTRIEIERILAPGGTVHLLGGTTAVSQAVEDELIAAGYDVDRLAGASRVETAIAVADRVRELAPGVQAVALARAGGPADNPTAGWADSVTGGAWGAATGVPILVTDTAEVHPAVAAWLDADQPNLTVLFGGTAALSDAVAAAVPNDLRIAGAERTETAAAIATDLWDAPTSGLRRFMIIDGFHEEGWAYGLAAAGMAADAGAPLLMVNGEVVPDSTAALVTGCDEVDLVLVGGGSVVSHPAGVELDARDQATC